MKAVHCPIDTSLNFTQANKLIRDLKPEHLVIPECYTQPPITAPHRTDLVIEPVGVSIYNVKLDTDYSDYEILTYS